MHSKKYLVIAPIIYCPHSRKVEPAGLARGEFGVGDVGCGMGAFNMDERWVYLMCMGAFNGKEREWEGGAFNAITV